MTMIHPCSILRHLATICNFSIAQGHSQTGTTGNGVGEGAGVGVAAGLPATQLAHTKSTIDRQRELVAWVRFHGIS
jgi:hypothetical protein